jgi:hypothetical protein
MQDRLTSDISVIHGTFMTSSISRSYEFLIQIQILDCFKEKNLSYEEMILIGNAD